MREYCAAEKRGVVEELPKFLPRETEKHEVRRALVTDAHGAVLLRRYGPDAPTLSGLCELPSAEGVLRLSPRSASIAVKKRSIGNRAYTELIYSAKASPALLRRIAGDKGLFWASPTELATVTLSGPHRKWLGELL